ncbi:hypothetical protein AB0O01_10125 [Streptomyces sp. NPDC093252]|uniref:hypothetical protein n=1 Tax=Streptomyces sp. NPDC093252 TaxID=3154980 RepID=UPI0034187A94
MRTSTLVTLAGAGLGALLLTGCGGDDSADGAASSSSSSSSSSSASPSPSVTASAVDTAASPSPGGSPAASTGAGAAKLDGGWLGESDVDQVAMIIQGRTVMLAFQSNDGTARHACDGLLKDTAITLSCVDKNSTDRTRGTVELSSGDKLAIAWASGKKDLLTKSGDGELDYAQWGLPSPPAAN